MKKVILKFKKKTEKFGIVVEQSLDFISKDRAEDYITRLGDKIWDTEIIEV